jgi:sugar phosphate isomerase/epimerase
MFRTGSTSYVIPDHIVPNVEFLGPLVDDIQLVLFETDEFGSNLPDAGQVFRLNELAEEHHLTYTVHLPLDLRLGDDGGAGDISLVKARRVIDATRGLYPHAYTLHLDGRCLMSEHDGAVIARWQEASGRALELVSDWLSEPEKLGIENLEAWDPEAFAPLVKALPVGRTIDIGHLWLQGVDPIEHLERWIDRARVVHLHGIAERDHASLSHVSSQDLDRVTGFLMDNFSGVVTLEVFNLPDLTSSLDMLAGSMSRVRGGGS